jgi:hypothetical protein
VEFEGSSSFNDAATIFFSKLNNFILVFYLLPQLDCPQMIKSRPPCALHQSNLLTYTSFIVRECFWLIVVFDFPVRSHLRTQPILFSIFIPLQFAAQYKDTTPPQHIPPRSHLLSDTPPLRGPQENMSFFQIASGPILSISFHLKVCQYDPCKVLLKKMTFSLPTYPPKSVFFYGISDWTSD